MRRRRRHSNHAEGLPAPDDPSFRVTCNEIAEQLSKSWRFKLQVIGIVALALFALAALTSGIVGWSIFASLAKERQRFQEQAQRDIGNAKEALEIEIAEQFKKENVQKTMEAAAGKEAAALLQKSVEPSIKDFQQRLDTSREDLEKRFTQFNKVITKNEEKSSANVESLRTELARLQKRNDLTALADKAISEGDVEAYRQLERMVGMAKGDESNAAISELVRVFQTYSIFSGVSRTGGVHLNASEINPAKNKEEQLEIDDLLPLLRIDNPLGRAKVAELIAKKAKRGSYKTEEVIAEALKRETHLEAFRQLAIAFRSTT